MSNINVLTQDQVELAKNLANPTDKKIRDETLQSLRVYLKQTKDLTHIVLLKLWKALYYCLWLCDKEPVQKELCQNFAELMNDCPNDDIRNLFLLTFFQTMLREWSSIDKHRINKYYILIRYFLRQIFLFFQKHKYDNQLITNVCNLLQDEILSKIPNGPRFHIVDIYIEELYEVTKGKINTAKFILLLQPFFKILQNTKETIFHERVISSIFKLFIENYSKEYKEKNNTIENIHSFYRVKSTVLQGIIFEIASTEDINEGNRKRLYALHKDIATMTGKDFVDGDDIEMDDDAIEVDEPVVTDKDNKKKNKKRKLEKENDEEVVKPKDDGKKSKTVEVVEENPKEKPKDSKKAPVETKKVEKEVAPVKATKAETKKAEKEEVPVKAAKAEAVPVKAAKAETKKVEFEEIPVKATKADKKNKEAEKVSTETVKKVTEATPAPVEKEEKLSKKEKKQKKEEQAKEVETKTTKTEKKTVDAPVKEAPKPIEDADYIAAAKFSGAKAGYVYHKGDKGMGYYKDMNKAKFPTKIGKSTKKGGR